MNKILIALGLVASFAMEQTIDFGTKGKQVSEGWYTILDGVMGGLSTGKVSYEKESMIFSGTLSLENNGGFSSIRGPRGNTDMSKYDSVKLRIRGDGRTFSFLIEPDTRYYRPYFKYEFTTEPDTWTEVSLPIHEFNGFIMGRTVRCGLPDEILQSIERVGFMLSDKKPGEFRLEVDYIGFE
jgi:hypothetical protein